MWQNIKDKFQTARDWLKGLLSRLYADILERLPEGAGSWIAMGFGVLVVVYYVLGAALIYEIDDDLNFRPVAEESRAGSSRAVAVMAGLIEREVNHYGWVMNDPFFKPGVLLDNMPNYQKGMFSAFARFSMELRDQLGRARGTSTTDHDLEEAAGLLPYPGDVWIFNFSTSILPTASAERQYLKARGALVSYNLRLSTGQAVFERRSDNLLATLDRIALDLGASTAAIDARIENHAASWIDTGADDLFYSVKGQAYAYAVILGALKDDFADVIRDRDLETVYDQMLASLGQAATLQPLIVANGEPSSLMIANHLSTQGFYLLRARAQMREVTNILLK